MHVDLQIYLVRVDEVNSPIFLPNFNQIWFFLTDFHTSPQYQISWKYIQWKLCWYTRTDGHDKANRWKCT